LKGKSGNGRWSKFNDQGEGVKRGNIRGHQEKKKKEVFLWGVSTGGEITLGRKKEGTGRGREPWMQLLNLQHGAGLKTGIADAWFYGRGEKSCGPKN